MFTLIHAFGAAHLLSWGGHVLAQSNVREREPSHRKHAGMSVEIRVLRENDMLRLGNYLRPMDKLEVTSMVPDRPLHDVLVASGRASIRGRAGFWKGNLIACWGVAARSQYDGAPWLLATDAIDLPEVRRAFIRHGAEEMHHLADGFRHLWNLVHRDNDKARRWLRFMGFEFHDPKEYVISGEPFIRFEMEVM
jgi:hypothetical protein